MEKFRNRTPLQTIQIPVSILSPNGSPWMHCVEATKQKRKNQLFPIARIRVIAQSGVNVTVPLYTKEQQKRFEELRYMVRNSDHVSVNFSPLFVLPSPNNLGELYLSAKNFTFRVDDEV